MHRVPDSTLLRSGLVVAVIATLGSLYFSFGMHLYPCRLCWYQRILMYPLVVFLAVASYEQRATVYRTTLPLSLLGLLIATYHSGLQRGVFGQDGACGVFSCASIQYELFGVLSIPNLSLIAFGLLTLIGVGLARDPLTVVVDTN